MPEDIKTIQTAVDNSVREFFPRPITLGWSGSEIGFYVGSPDLLPPWYTRDCDLALRRLFYKLHNTLVQGAINLFIQNVLSTPYEISGGRNLTYQWQDIFFEADFGEGYDFWLSKVLTDCLTLNRGGFIGLSAYGAPDEPLPADSRVTGVYHLDALRVIPTGNLEYPYLYYSEVTNRMHRLHRTRVYRLVDLPSPDTRRFGTGLSALYRMAGVSNSQILLGRHQSEMLADMPPPGIALFSNVKSEHVDLVMQLYEGDRVRDGQSVYRAPVRMEALKPDEPAKVEFVTFAQVPEGFNYQEYLAAHVNMIALALSVDPQDIWPLTGQVLGTGTQSMVLAAKARGKGYGYMLKRLERLINPFLPKPLEFKFKWKNEQQDKNNAEIAQLWVNVANAMPISDQQRLELLANQVEAFQDVLLDEAGNIRLPDDDPKDAQAEPDKIATDATPLTPEGQVPQAPIQTTDSTTQQKEFSDTRSAFVDAVAAHIAEAQAGNINRTTFGARMRSSINTYGRAAYLDGLAAGGVEQDALTDDDLVDVAGLLAEQSQYVTGIGKEIFVSETGLRGGVDFRADLWGNKTLQSFYYAGVASADANGMYEFGGKDGNESCKDCRRLKGQIHRWRDWAKKKLRPGIDTGSFECGGWQCAHELIKTKGRARGSW